ncbi:MAG: MGMT family protein [Oscillospiraceae bacterium]|nr:MGMT family protein [Oscillospiraceae bacterium]
MTVFELIYEQVKKIPCGRVATYGQIAMLAGNPRWARAVGYALHANPDPDTIPCYRVVNRYGALSPAFVFGGINRQAELLEADGVEVRSDNTVDLEKYLWNGL